MDCEVILFLKTAGFKMKNEFWAWTWDQMLCYISDFDQTEKKISKDFSSNSKHSLYLFNVKRGQSENKYIWYTSCSSVAFSAILHLCSHTFFPACLSTMAPSLSLPGLAMVRHLTSCDSYSTVSSSCTWRQKTTAMRRISTLPHHSLSEWLA